MTDNNKSSQRGSPPHSGDEALLAAFNLEVVKQVERLDNLAKELFKLELAIPGLFIAALKLMGSTTQCLKTPLIFAFVFWLAAIVITLFGLFPRRYEVMRDVPRGGSVDGKFSIEGFYQHSARCKYWVLVVGAASFFVGVCLAAWSVVA